MARVLLLAVALAALALFVVMQGSQRIALMAPGLLDDVVVQQWAHVVRGMLAMAMVAVILGHICIGSIEMEGAFEGMRDGEVECNWARKHRGVWVEEELGRARRMVVRDAPEVGAG